MFFCRSIKVFKTPAYFYLDRGFCVGIPLLGSFRGSAMRRPSEYWNAVFASCLVIARRNQPAARSPNRPLVCSEFRSCRGFLCFPILLCRGGLRPVDGTRGSLPHMAGYWSPVSLLVLQPPTGAISPKGRKIFRLQNPSLDFGK